MKKYWPLILTLVITLILARSLFTPGLMQTHDGIWHIERILSMTHELEVGQFPVRWSMGLDNGYGLPVFNFVYPLPYYLAATLHLLGIGVVASYRLSTIFFYLLGSVGVYQLVSNRSRLLASAASIMYLLSPYLLLDLFVRAAFGELAVLGLAPWLFIVLNRLKTHRLEWFTPLPLALILLSHNFLGLFFLGLVLLLSLTLYRPWLKKYLISTLISLGLAAFFLLPMIGERGLLLSAPAGLENTDFARHYVYPSQLLTSPWGYAGSLPGVDPSEISYQLGFAQILLLILSLIFFTKELRLYLVLSLLSIFLSLNLASFFWDFFPFLKIIQFPWRLLAFPVIFSPLLLIHLYPRLKRGVALSVVIILLAIANSFNKTSPKSFLTDQEFSSLHLAYSTKFASAYRYELTPKWASIERDQPDLVMVSKGSANIENIVVNNYSLTFSADAPDSSTATVAYNYYPSWKLTVDGNPSDLVASSDGSISLPLLAGKHFYRLYLSSTPLAKIGNLVSLFSLFLVAYLALSKSKAKS